MFSFVDDVQEKSMKDCGVRLNELTPEEIAKWKQKPSLGTRKRVALSGESDNEVARRRRGRPPKKHMPYTHIP